MRNALVERCRGHGNSASQTTCAAGSSHTLPSGGRQSVVCRHALLSGQRHDFKSRPSQLSSAAHVYAKSATHSAFSRC